MTLQEEFDGYIAAVYPDPPKKGSEQYHQLRNVFFAGCVVVYSSPADFAAELARHRTESEAEAAFSQIVGGGHGQRVH